MNGSDKVYLDLLSLPGSDSSDTGVSHPRIAFVPVRFPLLSFYWFR